MLVESEKSAGLRVHLRLASLAFATIGLFASLLHRAPGRPNQVAEGLRLSVLPPDALSADSSSSEGSLAGTACLQATIFMLACSGMPPMLREAFQHSHSAWR